MASNTNIYEIIIGEEYQTPIDDKILKEFSGPKLLAKRILIVYKNIGIRKNRHKYLRYFALIKKNNIIMILLFEFIFLFGLKICLLN